MQTAPDGTRVSQFRNSFAHNEHESADSKSTCSRNETCRGFSKL